MSFQNYRRSWRRLFYGLPDGGCLAFLQGHVLLPSQREVLWWHYDDEKKGTHPRRYLFVLM